MQSDLKIVGFWVFLCSCNAREQLHWNEGDKWHQVCPEECPLLPYQKRILLALIEMKFSLLFRIKRKESLITVETLVWSLCQWYSVNHSGSQGKRLYLTGPLLYKSTQWAWEILYSLKRSGFFIWPIRQTDQIGLKKTKFDAAVKYLGAVKNASFINKVFIICLGQVKEVLLSLKAISTLYLAFCLLLLWDVQQKTTPEY